MEVSRATPAARDRVVDTVVTAFHADPAFRFFFPDESSYAEQAAVFAGHLFDRRVTRGTVWVVDGGAAVSLWDAPADDDSVAPAPPALALPDETLARMAGYDEAVHATLPTTPHWYLGVVATHPAYASRRWGRAVIAAGLAAAAMAGLPAYLETTNPGNIDMYRRGGWEVVDALTVEGLNVWIMRHPEGGA